MWDEPLVIPNASQERAQLRDGTREGHGCEGMHPILQGSTLAVPDLVPKVLDRAIAKLTFRWLEVQPIPSESIQDGFESVKMGRPVGGVYKDVVKIARHIRDAFEDNPHEAAKAAWGVYKPKGHDLKLKEAMPC